MNNVQVITTIVGGAGIIIIRLVALFSLTLVPRGNDIRDVVILRLVHFVSGGMLLVKSLILVQMAMENSDSISSPLKSCIAFYMLCRFEMSVYNIIEHLTEVSEINDPVPTQVLPTLTRRHRRTTTSGREELNGNSISFMKGLIAVCSFSLPEFFTALAWGLWTSIPSLHAWYTFGATVTHKFVVAFYIRTGLSAKKCEFCSATIYILVYTFLSSLGFCVATVFTIAEEDKATSIAVCYTVTIVTQTYLLCKLLYGQQDVVIRFYRAYSEFSIL